MKNCPFCKAEIDSDSKFCVYCMHSLEEKQTVTTFSGKKPFWILWLVGAGLVAVGVALVLLIPLSTTPPKKAELHNATPEGSMLPDENPDASVQDEQIPDSSPVATPGYSNPFSSNPVNPGSTAPTKPILPTTPTTVPKPSTNPSSTPSTSPSVAPSTEPPTTPSTEPSAPPVSQQVVYNYRLVASGEEYSAGYVNSSNDIIITGIATPSSNGEYTIPDYIDGKRVLVIASNAFTGSGAKKVVIPATVKTIWGNAFTGCPLTDVYFCGSAIYAAGNAFTGITGSLTIHCSATCSDRNYRYYKNTAPNYGAVFAEWNG